MHVFTIRKMIDRSISSLFFSIQIIEFLILDQLKKTRSMIGIWLDINVAIITARWMIVQICMNRNEWITSHTYKTNNGNTSSRYQMSFYSITTHANSAPSSLLSISLFTSASCRQSYAIMTKEETLVYETDVWTTAIIRKKAIYIKHISTSGWWWEQSKGIRARPEAFSFFCSFFRWWSCRRQTLSAPLTNRSNS